MRLHSDNGTIRKAMKARRQSRAKPSRVKKTIARAKKAKSDRTTSLKKRPTSTRPAQMPPKDFKAVVEDQTEIISRFRADGTFTYVNDVFCRFFGKKPETLIGSRWQTVVVAEDLPMTLQKLRGLSPRKRVVTIENRVYSATGEVRWMQFINRALFKNGRLLETQSVGRDITEKKLAEEELKISEQRWKFALEGAGDGVWDWNPTTNEVVFSRQWKTMIGYEEDEIRNDFVEWKERVHPDDLPAAMAATMAHLEGRTPGYTSEFRMRCKDGSWKWIRSRGMVTSRDSQGRPLRVIGTHKDITERMLAKEREDRNLKLVAEGAPCPEVLEAIVRSVEAGHPGMVCGALVVDPKGSHVTEVAAPHLPPSLRKLIAESAVASGELCCIGRTILDGRRATDEGTRPGGKAGKLRRLATRAGLRACWAEPILSSTGLMLGAIACFYRELRGPTTLEISSVSAAASLAALAVGRQRSEEALHESKERYRRIVEHAQEGIWTIDAQSLTDYVNPKMAQMMGYSCEEMIGRPIDDFLDDEGRALLANLIERRKRGIAEQFEFKYIRKDGSALWAFVSTNPITDAGGVYVGAMALLTDISELKMVEAAFVDREARYRGIMESQLVGLMFWKLDGTVTEANAAFLDMVGYTQEDLREGRVSWSRMTPPEWREADQTAVGQLADRGHITPFEKEYIRKDGSRVPIILGGALLRHRPGEGVSFVVDISERKHAQKAVEESEARYRLLADNIDDIVLLGDPEGNRLYVSPSYYRKTGWTEAEVLSTDWRTRTHPDELPDIEKAREAIIRGEPACIEHRIRCKDGSWRWFETNCKPIRNQDGKVWRLLLWANDITEKKITETALRESEEKFRLLFENADDAIVITRRGRFADCNDITLKMFSCESRDQFIGHTPWRFSPLSQPDGSDSRTAALEKITAAEAGKPQRFEWMHRRLDGTSFLADVTLNKLDLGGEMVLQAIIRDISDRKKAEQALKESEERYARAARGTSDGLWDWNIVTGDTYLSPRWKALLGFEEHELENNRKKNYRGRLHPDDVARVDAMLKAHIEERQPYDIEVRLRMKDESYRWFRVRGEAERDAYGLPSRMAGAITDITDQKSAEKALRESEDRYARAVKGTSDGLWDWNILTGEDYLSPRWKEMLGFAPHELADHEISFFSRIHPDDVARVNAAVQAHLERQEPYDIEMRLRTRDDRYKWIRSRGQAERDDTGRAVRMAGSITDISEQKSAEAALRQSEERFRAIFEQAAVGVSITDVNTGRYVRVNQRFCDIAGLTEEQMTATTYMAITHPEDMEKSRSANEKLRKREIERLQQEKRFVRPDGSIVWAHISVSPLWKKGEEPSFNITVAEDITDRKRAEVDYKREFDFNTALVRHTSALILVTDLAGLIIHANPAFTKTLGYKLEDIKGRSAWKIGMMDAEEVRKSQARFTYLAGGEDNPPTEARLRTTSGDIRIVELWGTSSRDAAGNVERIIVTGVDVTEKNKLRNEVLRISEQEQARIGNDLHDGVGQTMTGIASLLEALESGLEGNQKALASRIRELMQESVAEVRRMSHGLSPAGVKNRGLGGGLQLLAETIRTNYRTGCQCEIEPGIKISDPEMETHLFRIAQEAVNNALRHGKPKRVSISLKHAGSGECVLQIEDDGAGLKARQGKKNDNGIGIGVRIMDYRASLIGGTLTVKSRPRGGVVVTCRFPLGGTKAVSTATLPPEQPSSAGDTFAAGI